MRAGTRRESSRVKGCDEIKREGGQDRCVYKRQGRTGEKSKSVEGVEFQSEQEALSWLGELTYKGLNQVNQSGDVE